MLQGLDLCYKLIRGLRLHALNDNLLFMQLGEKSIIFKLDPHVLHKRLVVKMRRNEGTIDQRSIGRLSHRLIHLRIGRGQVEALALCVS